MIPKWPVCAVTDYTILGSTIMASDDGRLVERGIYTNYVIVSKETTLGIAVLTSKPRMRKSGTLCHC